MDWLNDLLRRPPVDWWDLARHPRGVGPDLRGPEADSRHARRADGARRRRSSSACSSCRGWGHLETVNWLIRNLAGYVVFAIIVLFQSDIRRALAHLGRAPFFRYFAKAESAEESIEELVVAASMLSTQADRRDHRHRAADRAAQLHRGRHSARRGHDLRPAGQHLSAGVAAARRRGHRAGRSRGGRRLLPAADGQSEAEQGARLAASRRASA